MKREIVDVHIHVNAALKERALPQLIEDLEEDGVAAGVLIVNTKEQMDIVRSQERILLENRNRLKIVSGINIHNKNPYAIYEYFYSKGLYPGIKIHPKLFDYKVKDFSRIEESIARVDCDIIVVDTLYFGEQIDNHIGIELGIFLAKAFPEKTIVLAHSGSIKLLECQMYTRNLPNVYYDLSFTASYLNHTSIRMDMINFLKYTSGRIMYGSDYPDFAFGRAFSSMLELCEDARLTEEQVRNVFSDNAKRIYGINI